MVWGAANYHYLSFAITIELRQSLQGGFKKKKNFINTIFITLWRCLLLRHTNERIE